QPALSLSRFQLDEILIRAAVRAGAGVLCNTRASAIARTADGFSVASSRGEFQARAVLNAAGRNSARLQNSAGSTPARGAKYVGLKAHFRGGNFPRGLVELHAWRGGYCGLARVEDGVLNVCLLARYESLDARSPQEFWSWLLNE